MGRHLPPYLEWCLSLLVVAFACQVLAQPLPGNAVQTSPGSAFPTCPFVVTYTSNLGQGADTAQVPIFVAQVALTNNDLDVSVESWRLGWRFPFGSVINSSTDIFDMPDAGPYLITTPDIPEVVLEGSPARNLSIPPGGSKQFGFLGTKGAGPLSPENPYGVGAPTDVAFNNLVCSMLPPAATNGNQNVVPAAPDATPGASVANPTQISVEYAPIQYTNQPFEGPVTQFLLRLRNIQNVSTLPMSAVGLQYWFEGPEGSGTAAIETNPWDFFQGSCKWATMGCESVVLGISQGYADIPGARFALNISFTDAAGVLVPTGSAALAPVFVGQGLDVSDVLLEVTTKAGIAQFDPNDDFSFIETPALDLPQDPAADEASTIVPRRAVENPFVPAYLGGQLVWGTLPEAVNATVNETDLAAFQGQGQTALPDGVICEAVRGGTQQSCSLQAIYCCVSADPAQPKVLPVAPTEFPPTSPTPLVIAPTQEQEDDSAAAVPGTEEEFPDIEQPYFPPLPPPGSGDSVSGSPIDGAGDDPNAASSSGNGSLGWVAGIAVGAAVSLLAALAGFAVLRRRRLRRSRKEGVDIDKEGALDGQHPKHDSESGGDFIPSEMYGHNNISGTSGGGGAAVAVFAGAAYGRRSGDHHQHQTFQLRNGREESLPWIAPVNAKLAPGSHRAGSHSVTGSPPPSGTSSNRPLLPFQYHSRHSHLQGAAGSVPDSPAFSSGYPSAHPLYKYPSGISGVSGVSSDPTNVLDTFESDGRTRTLTYSPDGAASIAPLSPFAAAGAANGYHRGAHGSGGAGASGLHGASSGPSGKSTSAEDTGPGPLPDNLLQLLERKARTAPTVMACGPFRRASLDEDRCLDDDDSQCASPVSDAVPAAGPIVASWQARRSASWDGVLHDTLDVDEWSHVQRLKRRRTQALLPGPLPPMSPLPPPLLPSAVPGPDVDMNVDWSELEGHLGRCLGTGGFGSVYEATWRGKQVAVKMLPPFTAQDPRDAHPGQAAYEALLREIALASKFNCERLVRVYGASTKDRSKCCLIMELVAGGNLFQRIYDRRRRRMTYLEILQLAHDVAEALAYLHPSVVHRDLKPQNVLLDEDGRAKLADFGISRVKDPAKSYLTQVTAENGTPMYMAPEQMNGTRLDEKVDVYALGCILNEAWTRRQPWKDAPHFFQIILKVAINGERPWIDPDCPDPLRRLITKCWHQDPHLRPSTAEIVRLTELMTQEELRRWENLGRALPVARGPIKVNA